MGARPKQSLLETLKRLEYFGAPKAIWNAGGVEMLFILVHVYTHTLIYI